jgi:hypothetical protein
LERIKQPLKRLVVGADGHEYHRMLPAYRIRDRRAALGHWTRNSCASGYTIRPLSDTDSILVTLST